MPIIIFLFFYQEVASQTFTNATIDNTGQLAPLSAQEAANATLTLSAAVAALAAGQLTQESSIIPASQPVVVSDNNNSVNQAWFTTKEDKDNLHGKGQKYFVTHRPSYLKFMVDYIIKLHFSSRCLIILKFLLNTIWHMPFFATTQNDVVQVIHCI